MITLATTRFNTETWIQMQEWLTNNNWDGCIYGTPRRTKQGMSDTMIVLEMHNDKNEIKAISLLKNHAILSDKTHQIYKDRNYNRYIYKSKYRIVIDDDKKNLLPIEKKIIAIFNQLLFKGACHLKRAQGITAIPSWIIKNKYVDFIKHLKELFARVYKV